MLIERIPFRALALAIALVFFTDQLALASGAQARHTLSPQLNHSSILESFSSGPATLSGSDTALEVFEASKITWKKSSAPRALNVRESFRSFIRRVPMTLATLLLLFISEAAQPSDFTYPSQPVGDDHSALHISTKRETIVQKFQAKDRALSKELAQTIASDAYFDQEGLLRVGSFKVHDNARGVAEALNAIPRVRSAVLTAQPGSDIFKVVVQFENYDEAQVTTWLQQLALRAGIYWESLFQVSLKEGGVTAASQIALSVDDASGPMQTQLPTLKWGFTKKRDNQVMIQDAQSKIVRLQRDLAKAEARRSANVDELREALSQKHHELDLYETFAERLRNIDDEYLTNPFFTEMVEMEGESQKVPRILRMAMKNGYLNYAFGVTIMALMDDFIQFKINIGDLDQATDVQLLREAGYNAGLMYAVRTVTSKGWSDEAFLSLYPETLGYIGRAAFWRLAKDPRYLIHARDADQNERMWLVLTARTLYRDFRSRRLVLSRLLLDNDGDSQAISKRAELTEFVEPSIRSLRQAIREYRSDGDVFKLRQALFQLPRTAMSKPAREVFAALGEQVPYFDRIALAKSYNMPEVVPVGQIVKLQPLVVPPVFEEPLVTSEPYLITFESQVEIKPLLPLWGWVVFAVLTTLLSLPMLVLQVKKVPAMFNSQRPISGADYRIGEVYSPTFSRSFDSRRQRQLRRLRNRIILGITSLVLIGSAVSVLADEEVGDGESDNERWWAFTDLFERAIDARREVVGPTLASRGAFVAQAGRSEPRLDNVAVTEWRAFTAA